jgi:hypothetical protein
MTANDVTVVVVVVVDRGPIIIADHGASLVLITLHA